MTSLSAEPRSLGALSREGIAESLVGTPDPLLAVAAFAAWTGIVAIQSRVIDPVCRELEVRTGLTARAYHALLVLRDRPSGCRMNELADELSLSRGGTTKVVDRLEQAELVQRYSPQLDRRATYARITREGLVAVERAAPEHEALLVAHLGPYLGAADLVPLTQIASRLRSPSGGQPQFGPCSSRRCSSTGASDGCAPSPGSKPSASEFMQ